MGPAGPAARVSNLSRGFGQDEIRDISPSLSSFFGVLRAWSPALGKQLGLI